MPTDARGTYHWVVKKACMDTAAFPSQPGLVKIVPQFGFLFSIKNSLNNLIKFALTCLKKDNKQAVFEHST